MDLQTPGLAKPTCRFVKGNGEFCKRSVALGEGRCWQHAATITHKLKSLTRHQKVIGSLLTLSLTLLGLYFSYVGARSSLFKEHITSENIGTKVTQWLTANSRLRLRPLQLPGTLFSLEVSSPYQGQLILLKQFQQDSGNLMVGIDLYITDPNKDAFNKLSSEQKEELEDIVSQEIAKTGMEFSVEDLPVSIEVHTALPITDDLNQGILDGALTRVINANIVARNAFVTTLRHFGSTEKPPATNKKP